MHPLISKGLTFEIKLHYIEGKLNKCLSKTHRPSYRDADTLKKLLITFTEIAPKAF